MVIVLTANIWHVKYIYLGKYSLSEVSSISVRLVTKAFWVRASFKVIGEDYLLLTTSCMTFNNLCQ